MKDTSVKSEPGTRLKRSVCQLLDLLEESVVIVEPVRVGKQCSCGDGGFHGMSSSLNQSDQKETCECGYHYWSFLTALGSPSALAFCPDSWIQEPDP